MIVKVNVNNFHHVFAASMICFTACNCHGSLLTGQENNITPGDKSGPGKSTCRPRGGWEDCEAKHFFLQSNVLMWLRKSLLLSVYVSTRIHTPLMATTASAVTRKRLNVYEERRLPFWGQLRVCKWLHSHMAYWKAFDFTSRLMPVEGERKALRIRKWETFFFLIWLNRNKETELAFENEEGRVREIIKPMFSTASCLR